MRPYATNIEDEAKANEAFRRVLFTGPKMQLVLMSLNPGEEIGAEIHPDTDQFFRIEEGMARVELDSGTFQLDDDSVLIVPAGTRHNIINPSSYRDLKLVTIYSPPQHPPETLHRTKADADAAHTMLI